jgi:GT2 family glycosyltransferase
LNATQWLQSQNQTSVAIGFPRVGLVTIWYRAAAHRERFLSDLTTLDYPWVESVFVVHDHKDAELTRFVEGRADATIIEPRANLGTAAGWNAGIRLLLENQVPYVGIWNLDVRLEPHCLRKLVEVMEADASIGACQPLLLYSDAPDTVEMFGGSVEVNNGSASHDYAGTSVLSELPGIRDVQYLDGGTMLIRSAVFRQIGGFDERLFLYDEDCDLSIRIQRANYRTVAVRDARAWHYHRQTHGLLPAPHSVFYLTRNKIYLVRKWAGESATRLTILHMLVHVPRVVLYYARRGSPRHAWAHVSGLMHGIVGAMGKRGWVD